MNAANPLRKAVFLDRDGVINRDLGYVFKREHLEIMPGVGEGLKQLQSAGYILIVITNQSGVARGKYSLYDVFSFHQHLSFLLDSEYRVKIQQFYICPHLKAGVIPEFALDCRCRKPMPLLVQLACQEFAIDPTLSFFIGDKESDIQCALAAGVRPIFLKQIDTALKIGKDTLIEKDTLIAKDFAQATQFILHP